MWWRGQSSDLSCHCYWKWWHIITQSPRLCLPRWNMDICQGPQSNERRCLSDKALTRQTGLYERAMTRYMTAISKTTQQVFHPDFFFEDVFWNKGNNFTQLLQSSFASKKKAFLLTVCSYLRVSGQQLEGLVHLPLLDSSPQVQEVSWLSSVQVNDVTCGHGQTGSIHCKEWTASVQFICKNVYQNTEDD